MIKEQFSRTAKVFGEDAIEKLNNKHVIVFGVGGVGGYVVEALVRSGIGQLSVVDNDTICESNLNRQIIALHSTIGMEKVDVIADRAKDINPDIKITKHKCFFLPENAGDFDFSQYDYVVDAVDTVTAKIAIIEKAKAAGVPVISSMGTGNKLNPMGFKVAYIEKTAVCPLARVMRRELKARHISKVKCVYSEEMPAITTHDAPGSVSFVPGAAGLLIAGQVVQDLIEK